MNMISQVNLYLFIFEKFFNKPGNENLSGNYNFKNF
jgi:hypothetical protein